MSIRIGISGYGNLGKGIECAIKQNPDMELAAVFTRRDPSTVQILTEGVPVCRTDEPLSGLDHDSIELVLQLMQECQEKLHQTFLIISHQIDELAQFCNYRLVFADQQLKYVEE